LILQQILYNFLRKGDNLNAKAFAPGHISGFFSPVFSKASCVQTGSCGAGVCLSLGATSSVMVEPAAQQDIQIFLNGKQSPAPVTKMALQLLLGSSSLKIHVKTRLDLPRGQGFGMSAAGALSATAAVASCLQLPSDQALKAAHCAEVQLQTGLGDVLACQFGGFEVRRSAGLPPWGMIEHIPGDYPLVLCVIGQKIQTKKVLSDVKNLDRIASYGRLCTKKLLEHPSVETFMRLSYDFTLHTNLMNENVHKAIQSAMQYGLASMCMLGNAVFALGKTEQLVQTLSSYGKVVVCSVDQKGLRLV